MHQLSSPVTQARQLTLPAHPIAVPWVRRLAGQALTEWGLEGLSDTALLLMSELVTNAVQASAPDAPALAQSRPRAGIAVTLSLTGTSLLIEVWDAHPGRVDSRYPDTTAESGRGLLLVAALASAWGQRAADDGKVVWCELELVPAAAAAPAPTLA
jgi:hypothetical protein